MITTKNTTLDNVTYTKKSTVFDLINNKIQKEQENSLGITILLIMVSTMIASVSVGLAIHGEISVGILIFSAVTAMGTNATAFGQGPFKYIVWAAIISIIGNTILSLYQILLLLL
ncbi:hypothetical protein [Tenacibaculum amylolyticum]|uniref:hypothetical protein n=1 Tax=Tenacibaculum amylolyticum TaxID=104269 RepID=UPI0038B5C846